MIESENDIFFKIIVNNKHIGNLRLLDIDKNKKTLSFGIMIGNEKFHNKGIATSCLKLIMKYVFKRIKFNKLKFGCLIKNKYAIKLYVNLKFKKYKSEKINFIAFVMSKKNYFKSLKTKLI